jgi:polyisoprenoid-binding protein YceI
MSAWPARNDRIRNARAAGGSRRPRRWWRWTVAGLAALMLIIVLAAVLLVKLQPGPAPLALPVRAARSPAGPVDGTWQVAPGSQAGFRVRETALGFTNYAAGQTSAVTGTLVISGDRLTGARFLVDLAALKVSGKTQPQFARSLDTAADPNATFTLTRPVTLSPAFTSGAVITATATGRLAMHGVSRLVTLTIRARRDGTALQAAGSIPVAFPAWDIQGPAGYGFLGSLADRGTAEFLLTLRPRG